VNEAVDANRRLRTFLQTRFDSEQLHAFISELSETIYDAIVWRGSHEVVAVEVVRQLRNLNGVTRRLFLRLLEARPDSCDEIGDIASLHGHAPHKGGDGCLAIYLDDRFQTIEDLQKLVGSVADRVDAKNLGKVFEKAAADRWTIAGELVGKVRDAEQTIRVAFFECLLATKRADRIVIVALATAFGVAIRPTPPPPPPPPPPRTPPPPPPRIRAILAVAGLIVAGLIAAGTLTWMLLTILADNSGARDAPDTGGPDVRRESQDARVEDPTMDASVTVGTDAAKAADAANEAGRPKAVSAVPVVVPCTSLNLGDIGRAAQKEIGAQVKARGSTTTHGYAYDVNRKGSSWTGTATAPAEDGRPTLTLTFSDVTDGGCDHVTGTAQ
jgi:hypothetical protein